MASKFNFGKRLRVTEHEYRKTNYGAALRWRCSCENHFFLSKRWHPSFNVPGRLNVDTVPSGYAVLTVWCDSSVRSEGLAASRHQPVISMVSRSWHRSQTVRRPIGGAPPALVPQSDRPSADRRRAPLSVRTALRPAGVVAFCGAVRTAPARCRPASKRAPGPVIGTQRGVYSTS